MANDNVAFGAPRGGLGSERVDYSIVRRSRYILFFPRLQGERKLTKIIRVRKVTLVVSTQIMRGGGEEGEHARGIHRGTRLCSASVKTNISASARDGAFISVQQRNTHVHGGLCLGGGGGRKLGEGGGGKRGARTGKTDRGSTSYCLSRRLRTPRERERERERESGGRIQKQKAALQCYCECNAIF